MGVDGVAELALLCRLDLDDAEGVDLVDLAEALVALGLAGADRPRVVDVGLLEVLVALRGVTVLRPRGAGIDLPAAIGGEIVGVGQGDA